MSQSEINIEESWTQTLITVCAVPADKPILREIRDTARISANIKESIDIHNQDFIYELPLYRKDIIDLSELEREPTRDAQNQTFLQGVPVVIIPKEYKDEALQTMYMNSAYPPVNYEKIIASMNCSIPVIKYDRSSQTTISIAPIISQHEATETLSDVEYEKHIQKYEKPSQNLINEKTIIYEILHFTISLALWISDPVFDDTSGEIKCSQEAQTIIRYDLNTGKILLDNETQTNLTCEPKYSNSKLLAECEETKSFVQNCLRDCFVKGIEPRIIIDDLLDEIIVKGANTFKCPMREQVMQTVTSCKCHEDTDEDVLQKLRIFIIVDPSEAPIMIMPLVDELLHLTCSQVSQDAQRVVKNILDSSVQRAISIGFKLADIREQSQPKSIEQILDRKRKRIMKSMLKAEKETTATQTVLAGVPEITKIKEYKEMEDTKVPHTQSIPPTDKPDAIATTSKETKNSKLTSLTKKMPTIAQLLSPCITCKKTRDVSNEDINVMTPRENIQAEDSITEWTRIVDNALTKTWSPKDSISTSDITTTSSMSKIISSSCCERSSYSENLLNLQVTKAFQTLKSAFCTRNTCVTTFLATLKEYQLPSKNRNENLEIICNIQNCTLLKLDQCRK